MSKYKHLFVYGLLVFMMVSCSDHREKLYPFGWTKSDASIDSLTVALEWAYIRHEANPVVDSLTREYDRQIKRLGTKENSVARKHYWDGRRMQRHGDIDGAFREFEKAIEQTDSSKYPYDVARARWNMERDFPCTPESYRYLVDRVEFFSKEGDLPLETDYLLNLGTLMNRIGNYSAALQYYSQADSVMKLYGDSDNLVKNRINYATTLDLIKKDEEATEILRDVLKHPSLQSDIIAMGITNWNIYLYNDDLDALRNAYALEQSSPYPDEEYLKLYEGCLMREYAKRDMRDSVAYYLAKGESREVEWSMLNYEESYSLGRGYAAIQEGDYKLAAEQFLKAYELKDSINSDDLTDRIQGLETQRRISDYRHKEEMERISSRNRLLIIVISIICVAGVIVWILLRRLHRQRLEALKDKLRREHSMRKVMGLQIAMADTDRIVEELRALVDELPDEPSSVSSVRRRLSDALNSHTIANSTRDSFLTTFSEIKPDFSGRLASAYPGLSDAETRLAIFIALGLDNKHISRLLNIRPESVKQARWRMRNKMNLKKDESLDEVLRKLVDKD